MDEQPNENRPSVPTWVWIITIFAVILGLQLLFSGRLSGPDEISQQQFFTLVKNSEVDVIELDGDRLEAYRVDGSDETVTVGVTTKDAQSSLEEVLAYNDLTSTDLEELNVEVQVRNLSLRNNLFSILFTIGPVLLLIWIFSRGFRQMQGGGGNSIFGFGRSRAPKTSVMLTVLPSRLMT